MASVKESWIRKYGEKIGLEMWEERKKQSSCTIESFIKKYGDVDGKKKFSEWKSNCSRSRTIDGYKEKYGEIDGSLKYYEKNLKLSVSVRSLKLSGKTDEEIKLIKDKHRTNSRITEEIFIEKYGQIIGSKKWNNRIFKSKLSSKRSLDYWININNGDIEKSKIDLSNYQRRDKLFYIRRYGEIKGTEKYNEVKRKRFLGGFIEPCSIFQKEIEDYVKSFNFKKLYNHENPYCFLLDELNMVNLNQSVVLPDILIKDNKLIIECFGDYWHCSEKYNENFFHEVIKKSAKEIREQDNKRIEFFKSKGFNVLIIWENEWKNNKEIIKNKIQYEINKKRS